MSTIPRAARQARGGTIAAAVVITVVAVMMAAAWLSTDPTVRAKGAPGDEVVVTGPADEGRPVPVHLELWVTPVIDEATLERVACTVNGDEEVTPDDRRRQIEVDGSTWTLVAEHRAWAPGDRWVCVAPGADEVMLYTDDPDRWRNMAIAAMIAAPLMAVWAVVVVVISRRHRPEER